MKKLILKMAAMTLFVCLTNTYAYSAGGSGSDNGGANGGGGSLVYPTRQEVLTAINDIWNYPVAGYDIRSAFESLERHLKEIQDPILKEVAEKFFNEAQNPDHASNTYPVFKVLSKVKFTVVETPCYEKQHRPRAASVLENNLGNIFSMSLIEAYKAPESFQAKLCYSMPILLKVPRASLHENLIALTAHEITHLFGYPNETEPIRIQNFFLEGGRDLIKYRSGAIDRARGIVGVLKYRFDVLQKDISNNLPDSVTCMHIGSLKELTSDLKDQIWNAWSESLIPARPSRVSDSAGAKGNQLYLDTFSLVGYCAAEHENSYMGSSSNWSITPLLNNGDRSGLSQRVKDIETKLSEIQKILSADLTK